MKRNNLLFAAGLLAACAKEPSQPEVEAKPKPRPTEDEVKADWETIPPEAMSSDLPIKPRSAPSADASEEVRQTEVLALLSGGKSGASLPVEFTDDPGHAVVTRTEVTFNGIGKWGGDRTLSASSNELQVCYQTMRRTQPDLEGTLEATVTFDAKDSPKSVTFEDNDFPEVLIGCVEESLMRYKLVNLDDDLIENDVKAGKARTVRATYSFEVRKQSG